jgi:superfamily II DNA or RNA helicase
MASKPGGIVNVRGERWRLARVDAYERCSVLTLDGRDVTNANLRLRVIEPFDRPMPVKSDRMVRRKRRSVLRTALGAIAHARPATGLWTAAEASIDLLPYQLEPALAVLRGATRLLLADAVGLGKTIQAGLILAELRERGWAERALVLCPAGLRATWAAELQQRFHIDCAVLDHSAIAERVAVLPPGINPWSSHATIVASIDFVKRPEVLAALAGVSLDVLIADEAHHLTPGTDRGSAVARLAERTPWCVLVSATPHSGDVAAFDYLTDLGSHRDPIAIFRRTRREAGLHTTRRERVMRVETTDAESDLLLAVERYARAIWRGCGAHDRAIQLVAVTIARRAASSSLALERTLTRRLALLGLSPEPIQASLPWGDEDESDGAGNAAMLARPGLADQQEERAAIERLLALGRSSEAGSKIRWLLRALARINEPAIVFTEYRDTVEAVLAALPAGIRAGSISGGLPPDRRRDVVESFNRGDLDVLIATDAAGEGLNLHHRCRLVIDLELPWNPLRLEQRIGRVDRLGQRRRVHAIRLFHPRTVEERVLERLRLRQRRAGLLNAHASSGDELDVARAIFDGNLTTGEGIPAIETSVVPAAAAEMDRLSRQRASGPHQRSAADDTAWVSPRHRRSHQLVALHSVSCASAFGAVVAEYACAHVIAACAPRSGHTWRQVIERAVPGGVALALRSRSQGLCAETARDLTPLREKVAARITSIRAHVARERTREIQRSLFDRRAEEVAAHAGEAASRLDMALARRQARVAAPATLEGVAARLVAVWPLRARPALSEASIRAAERDRVEGPALSEVSIRAAERDRVEGW